MKPNYSVVRNGPIGYFETQDEAFKFAHKVIREGCFRVDDEVFQLKAQDKLTVFKLNGKPMKMISGPSISEQ